MEDISTRTVCCNNKRDNNKNCSKATLRRVTSYMEAIAKTANLTHVREGLKLCALCRNNILKRKPEQISDGNYQNIIKNEEVQPTTSEKCRFSDSEIASDTDELITSDTDTEKEINQREIIFALNKFLPVISVSPIDSKKIAYASYRNCKFNEIVNALKKTLNITVDTSDAEANSLNACYYKDMKNQLVDAFKNTSDHHRKIKILTTVPQCWSLSTIQKEFQTTNYMARLSKQIQQVKGVLCTPNSERHIFSTSTIECVKEFYLSQEISRVMPSPKDYVTMIVNDEKKRVQKQMLLHTLKEAYELFKEKYSENKIGFTKFTMLRPKNCVIPGSPGTHAVCVCAIHQNMKLLLFAIHIETITDGSMQTYKNCIEKSLCQDPSEKCYLLKCEKCPGVKVISHLIKTKCEEYMISTVTFRQWESTDRCNLNVYTENLDIFIDVFENSLKKLITHDFKTCQQYEFLKNKKDNIDIGEILVMGDFSENYTYLIQNEAQGYHWNNKQATIHPWVAYYKDFTGALKHLSFVNISDHLAHNAVTVHVFLTKLIIYLKAKIGNIKKIIYFTDGAGSQYKNKNNFKNICLHKQDFDIECEWHFYTTSHGKGPCDGIGGTLKRMARRESLTRANENQIQTAKQLYDFAVVASPEIKFCLTTEADYTSIEKKLLPRFEASKPIKGTHKFHCYIPISPTELLVKEYSNSKIAEKFNI